jgi:hypothetical protein
MCSTRVINLTEDLPLTDLRLWLLSPVSLLMSHISLRTSLSLIAGGCHRRFHPSLRGAHQVRPQHRGAGRGGLRADTHHTSDLHHTMRPLAYGGTQASQHQDRSHLTLIHSCVLLYGPCRSCMSNCQCQHISHSFMRAAIPAAAVRPAVSASTSHIHSCVLLSLPQLYVQLSVPGLTPGAENWGRAWHFQVCERMRE